jgi:hypothetical protein
MIGGCKKHGAFTEPVCPRCAEELKANPPAEPESKVIIGGLDLAKYHDYSALVLIEVIDRTARVAGIKVWPHVDYHVVVGDTVEIYQRKKVRQLAIDATGVGAPIAEMFSVRGIRTEDIKFGEYVEYTSPWGDHERAPVKWAMMEYARSCLQHEPPQVKFGRGSEELQKQLAEQELIVGPTERPTYQHPEGRHDDLAWAFLMALYTARKWLTSGGFVAVRA